MKKPLCCMLAAIMLAGVLTLAGCGEGKPKAYEGQLFAMDTYITYSVVTGDAEKAQEGLSAIEEAFTSIDAITDRFTPGSELSRLNDAAGIEPFKVSEDLLSMIQVSLEWEEKTDGGFNILIGRAMDLWDFQAESPEIPDAAAVEEALSHMDTSRIQVDAGASTVFLPDPEMVLDLGGVAKGYATDLAVAKLEDLGIKNALINAGGNVYALGKREDGGPWKVGVRDPRNSEGLAALLEVSDEALVSSGDYYRYFIKDGVRYHHILDPATGFPARLCAGTTVVMESATLADILSTAIFIKGPQTGLDLAESIPEVDGAMVLLEDGSMYGTPGMTSFIPEE